MWSDVPDVIMYAKFWYEIFKGCNFTAVEISIFWLIFEWYYNIAALLRCL